MDLRRSASRGCASLHPWLPSVAAPRLQRSAFHFVDGNLVVTDGNHRLRFLVDNDIMPHKLAQGIIDKHKKPDEEEEQHG